MTTEVIATESFASWFQGLSTADAERVTFVVELLREKGVTLGHPYSSAIKGADFALRELRAQAGRGPLRVFYAFDPRRRAVLLLGGDKSGDDQFYEAMITRAKALWDEFVAALAAEKTAADKTRKKGKR